ncbi:Transcriptional regulator, AraC family [Sphingobium indicum BiD32]|uniref:Transcriptional regulator, AraC family n=1 Tax=Sphingobium indicum BiD32 TaxID=1301087 RepID=N1MI46_9SPHN|nr:AraC family transcriptional regulator [Sphingobium indicum]CCW16459.1 Transcriptional regulator, AraC family [Sphingobium indicum BiD32]
MIETLFTIDRGNYRDCQHLFRGEREQEYYRGDYWMDDGSVIDVSARRKPAGPSAVILLRSATRLFFRRTRQHIREDGTDLSVLWFVKRGRLLLSNQMGSRSAQCGDMLITRSTSPFLIECQPDAHGLHEVLHVTVPTHVLRGLVDCDASAGLLLSTQRPELAIADTILSGLFQREGDLAEETTRTLVEAALAIIGQGLRGDASLTPPRQSVAEKRFADVQRFVEVHLSDPGLSAAMTARGCGISPRYLTTLLQQNGTSFSQLIWDQRLEQARKWMARADANSISISEIAYGVGFKSPAHFSRMFKRTYKRNPSDYRLDACAAQVMAAVPCTVPSGVLH